MKINELEFNKGFNLMDEKTSILDIIKSIKKEPTQIIIDQKQDVILDNDDNVIKVEPELINEKQLSKNFPTAKIEFKNFDKYSINPCLIYIY